MASKEMTERGRWVCAGLLEMVGPDVPRRKAGTHPRHLRQAHRGPPYETTTYFNNIGPGPIFSSNV
jgi:hypothetical protein